MAFGSLPSVAQKGMNGAVCSGRGSRHPTSFSDIRAHDTAHHMRLRLILKPPRLSDSCHVGSLYPEGSSDRAVRAIEQALPPIRACPAAGLAFPAFCAYMHHMEGLHRVLGEFHCWMHAARWPVAPFHRVGRRR